MNKNIFTIPLNNSGIIILINGVEVVKPQWDRVVSYVSDFYSNGLINSSNPIDEIINQLENFSTDKSLVDPLIVAFFSNHSYNIIEILIAHGESKDWKF